MWLFSEEIASFLKKLGLDRDGNVSMVPKSDSCGDVGDFLIFRYKLGIGIGSRAQRLAMIVTPVVKDASTGNFLLTVVSVPPEEISSVEELKNLYRNRRAALPEDNYRTYIMTKIYGPLLRISLRLGDKGRGTVSKGKGKISFGKLTK